MLFGARIIRYRHSRTVSRSPAQYIDSWFAYPHCPHMLLPRRVRVSAALPHEPAEHVVYGFGRDDDIERRWHCAALLEVAHPELTPSELPLGVGTLLSTRSEVRSGRESWGHSASDKVSIAEYWADTGIEWSGEGQQIVIWTESELCIVVNTDVKSDALCLQS